MNEDPDLNVRRLVLRDDAGRKRAVLETVPTTDTDPPHAPGVRLTLIAATGDPLIELLLDDQGDPRVSIGHPDRGTSVILLRSEIQVWDGGNEIDVHPCKSDD